MYKILIGMIGETKTNCFLMWMRRCEEQQIKSLNVKNHWMTIIELRLFMLLLFFSFYYVLLLSLWYANVFLINICVYVDLRAFFSVLFLTIAGSVIIDNFIQETPHNRRIKQRNQFVQ